MALSDTLVREAFSRRPTPSLRLVVAAIAFTAAYVCSVTAYLRDASSQSADEQYPAAQLATEYVLMRAQEEGIAQEG